MRTHQFSTSPGRCVGKGGRPGWRGRGEPSRARAPGPGPLSTGRAARAWLPGSTAGETGPWPGAQRPRRRGAGQPADRTGEARLIGLAGTPGGGGRSEPTIRNRVTCYPEGQPRLKFHPRPLPPSHPKDPRGLWDKTDRTRYHFGVFFFSK